MISTSADAIQVHAALDMVLVSTMDDALVSRTYNAVEQPEVNFVFTFSIFYDTI